ncbi:hypothetical protein Scep_028796 [Stephania cephalantha]|uniref:Uncharacterized protein n=1 Tax=Stephania cephalantha TaxID=152367 RepID=A0AAP0HJY3_9MAGN
MVGRSKLGELRSLEWFNHQSKVDLLVVLVLAVVPGLEVARDLEAAVAVAEEDLVVVLDEELAEALESFEANARESSIKTVETGSVEPGEDLAVTRRRSHDYRAGSLHLDLKARYRRSGREITRSEEVRSRLVVCNNRSKES